MDCKQQCSGHCRDSVSCNHVTGHCDGGCAAGWHDSFCKKGNANVLADTHARVISYGNCVKLLYFVIGIRHFVLIVLTRNNSRNAFPCLITLLFIFLKTRMSNSS